jgi:hypothetical protein
VTARRLSADARRLWVDRGDYSVVIEATERANEGPPGTVFGVLAAAAALVLGRRGTMTADAPKAAVA